MRVSRRPGTISSILKADLGCVTTKTSVKGHTLDIISVPIPTEHKSTGTLEPAKFETAY